MSKPKRPQWVLPLASLLVIAIFWVSFQRASNAVQPEQVSYSKFLLEVRSGHVSEVGIDEQLLIATLKTTAQKQPAQRISTQRIPGMDDTSLLGELEEQNVAFSGHVTRASLWTLVLPWVAPVLFFVLIFGYASRRAAQTPGPLTFGKSSAKIHDQSSEIKVSFKDVAGVEEAKEIGRASVGKECRSRWSPYH